ncbi:hypothetical protein WME98_25960 [Sorangium sp. So ce296]|uniref:hypothetical protein n=1 Tax=Sorangium sp. So ce296 TaxID=3133296 RepID=UPI003F6104A3
MSGMRERMARLERDATGMGTSNHGRFLSEAMQALRDPAAAADVDADEIEAPLRALRLLDALWGSSYADRPEPKVALNEIGGWLERRLLSTPGLKTAELLVELGWLKRLARHHEALRRQSTGGGGRAPAARPATKSFGARIAEVERRRRAALAMAPRLVPSAAPAPAATLPEAPAALPEEVAVQFAELGKAREERGRAAERVKKGKGPKDAELGLTALEGVARGMRLVCSTTRTAGMGEVFERIRMTPGAQDWVCYASGMERRADGVVFVGRLSLAPTRRRDA